MSRYKRETASGVSVGEIPSVGLCVSCRFWARDDDRFIEWVGECGRGVRQVEDITAEDFGCVQWEAKEDHVFAEIERQMG